MQIRKMDVTAHLRGWLRIFQAHNGYFLTQHIVVEHINGPRTALGSGDTAVSLWSFVPRERDRQ